ncbi:P-loop NTPase family protein [Thermofilum pendens]|uniref:hypothetical protein n=1 Tax=Thermofilum pendens TaxID=2269 RepID=UPI000A8805CB|nr:hypothetical protein [Thermofilum pendens]
MVGSKRGKPSREGLGAVSVKAFPAIGWRASARALATPGILLLDEPSSCIDRESRARLRGEVMKIVRSVNVATLLVSHCVEDSVVADAVVFMRRGGIAAESGTDSS